MMPHSHAVQCRGHKLLRHLNNSGHVAGVCRCEQLRKADAVEALVMSNSQYLEEFVVVRDIYVPTLSLWLADYPFIKRDVFERLSEDVYWSRQSE
jgi:hypothetical protein